MTQDNRSPSREALIVARTLKPDLFSDDETERHRAASPLKVEIAQARTMLKANAILAALAERPISGGVEKCWSCSCGWVGCYTQAELAEYGEPSECQECYRERLSECDAPSIPAPNASTQDEALALVWLERFSATASAALQKAISEVAAFEVQVAEQPQLQPFLDNWHSELAKAKGNLAVAKGLEAIVADRNEWRIQHENLLSVRQSDLAALTRADDLAANVGELEDELWLMRNKRDACQKTAIWADDQRLAAETTLAGVVGALEKYGEHQGSCARVAGDCICGLDEALKLAQPGGVGK